MKARLLKESIIVIVNKMISPLHSKLMVNIKGERRTDPKNNVTFT